MKDEETKNLKMPGPTAVVPGAISHHVMIEHRRLLSEVNSLRSQLVTLTDRLIEAREQRDKAEARVVEMEKGLLEITKLVKEFK